jgi:hypothetical protein
MRQHNQQIIHSAYPECLSTTEVALENKFANHEINMRTISKGDGHTKVMRYDTASSSNIVGRTPEKLPDRTHPFEP